jgi:hypothetical protein
MQMEEKIRKIINTVLVVVFCLGLCYLVYVGYSVYKCYSVYNQEELNRDPDYQEWEIDRYMETEGVMDLNNDGWDDRIYDEITD